MLTLVRLLQKLSFVQTDQSLWLFLTFRSWGNEGLQESLEALVLHSAALVFLGV